MGTSNRTIKGKYVLVKGRAGIIESYLVDLLMSEKLERIEFALC